MSKSVANIAEVNKGENSSIPGKQEQLLSRLEIFSQNLNSSETDLPNSLLTELPPRGETTKVFRGQKLFNCTVCNESFKTNRAMQMHLRQSHNLRHPDRNMFDCCFCSKIFHLKKDYHQHLTEDHGQSVSERYRFQLCACSDCGKMFYNSSALKTHVKAVHSKERLFQCDLCGKTFPTKKYLREHIKNVHLFKNCARNRKAPNETIKSKTDSSKTVKCNLCGTSFENNRQAAGHRVNCALFLLKSDDVDKVAHPTLTTASDESFVILPVNKNNPIKNPAVDHQTYNCVHCGKVYLKKPSLHCHLLSKHGNAKKPKLSECQVCGKHVLHIAIHMKQVHLYPDVRPHMCDVCGAAFKKTSALQTHRVIHTGVRYPCPVCGRGFTQRGDMRKHAKALHDMDLSANPSNMK